MRRRRELEPSYNVAPRADVPVVAESHGERVLDVVRWGLVPSWAKDLTIGDRMINARAETLLDEQRVQAAVRTAPVHRSRRRLLRVAEGRGPNAKKPKKQPWFIRRRDGEPLAFAGLWEIWHDREARRRRAPHANVRDHHDRSRTSSLAPIHDRMPVVLPGVGLGHVARAREPRHRRRLQKLLVPAAGRRARGVAGVDAREQGRQQRPGAARAGRR